MSKTLQARIRCPNCENQFETTLYRSIWIEFPENRKLVFDDKINRVTCPACKMQTKLEFPFLCTNVKEHIAVWYEPCPDPDVEKDAQLYAKHHGPSSFYATAPRIRDWNAFKEKIVELEQRTGMKPPSRLSPEMQEKMQGFVDHLKEEQAKKEPGKAKSRTGIAGLFLRLKDKLSGSRQDLFEDTGPLSIGGTIKSLMAQDAESLARGEIPEKRLIPHHAIKRDVILSAYHKDFQTAVSQIRSINLVEAEKDCRLAEIKPDFDKKIYGIKQLGWEDLDKIIALMKQTRTDFKELERDVRSKNSMYSIVDPL